MYKIILILFTALYLNANTVLNDKYFVYSNDIYISSMIKDPPRNELIYKIQKGRYSKKIRTKELLKTLREHGYRDITCKSRYVKFIKKSPIDTSKISSFIREYYSKHYSNIKIETISVEPRTYTEHLPENFSINIRKKSYLSKEGIVSIKTKRKRKIFFNYTIDATIVVYISKKKLKKGTKLSAINIREIFMPLSKLRAMPLQNLNLKSIQTKRYLKKHKIITQKDIELLNIVKKGSYIQVSINSGNMSISFSAKALKSGKLNDIIIVRKNNGKRFKVRITAKNRAETI